MLVDAVQNSTGAARLDVFDEVLHFVALALLDHDDVGVSQGKELPKSIQIHKGLGWKIGVLGFGPVRQRLVVDVSQLVAVPPELKTLQAKVCDKLNETPSSSEGPHCF